MIELNLLPDVKLDYIKAQQTRRLVISVSLLVSAVAVLLLILLLAANGLQKKHLSDLGRDIATSSQKLQNEPNINKILTVQNQLQSLTDLHASKPAASRLFDYFNQMTPVNVSISTLNIDFTQQTATINGSADSLGSVNKYTDTLKFTTYDNGTGVNSKAFSNVLLSSFGVSDSGGNSQPTNYTITMAYDKNIFDITQQIKLEVPNLTTTRSSLGQPIDLFQPANNGVKR
jgi:hypothetical protein